MVLDSFLTSPLGSYYCLVKEIFSSSKTLIRKGIRVPSVHLRVILLGFSLDCIVTKLGSMLNRLIRFSRGVILLDKFWLRMEWIEIRIWN